MQVRIEKFAEGDPESRQSIFFEAKTREEMAEQTSPHLWGWLQNHSEPKGQITITRLS